MSARWHVPSASATPWDGVDDASLTPAQRLAVGAQRDAYERAHSPGPHDAAFSNGYRRVACPACGSAAVVRRGLDGRGVQRYLCGCCGRGFTPLTGTIFEGHRLSLAGWLESLLGIMSHESLAGIARRGRRSPTTPPYQLAKLFLVLDGIQDGVVLPGRVRADEVMYPVPAAAAAVSPSGRRQGAPTPATAPASR